jgi:predicted membrane protein (TIGR00267 family)
VKALDEVRGYIRVGRLEVIARRYFVMNAFDGALTTLGILVGAYLSGSRDPSLILHAGVGAGIAMGVSGMMGAYMTEDAERRKELSELEGAMLTKLGDTVQGKARRFAPLFTAFVDGASPAATSIVILSPFMLAEGSFEAAFSASMAMTAAILFGLGAYLARIGGGSVVRSGLQMVAAGLAAAAAIYAVS